MKLIYTICIVPLFVAVSSGHNSRGQNICKVCDLIFQHLSYEIRHKFSFEQTVKKEIFLHNILEDVCEHISRYGAVTGPDGSVRYTPAFDETGEPIVEKNFEFNREVSHLFDHFCVGIVDDYYYEILNLFVEIELSYFTEETERELKNRFCNQVPHSCVY
ncbi:hypothetical protein LOD99_6796 [Oopsacas minuta]|uniref:DUF3456 domain-containing protein n=1 Tax=Oopsacas minuta TaxID=111878 RepID=A0AAV7JKV0_9METZ|nr:hypothetical protein LOD99_6796 [Oopsacas minuta]